MHWCDRQASDFRGRLTNEQLADAALVRFLKDCQTRGTPVGVLVAPDKAISHGVVCLTGGQPWGRLDVDQGEQCQHIHPPGPVAYGWICLACNQGNPKAERIASKHGEAVEAEKKPANPKPIKFKPKGRKAA
jgi:hypothetical protein